MLAEVISKKKKLCTRETGVGALDALHWKDWILFSTELEKGNRKRKDEKNISMIQKCRTKGISNEW